MATQKEVIEYIIANKASIHRTYYALKVTRKFIKEAIAEYESRTGEKLPMPVSTNKQVLYYAEVAKYISDHGCTRRQAAVHFGVTQQAISKVMGRQAEAKEPERAKPEKFGYSCPPIGLLWRAPPQSQASA